ncbi:hypothetical protein GCM10007108_12000 [Thermogymnomonas acidicola]|uniref:Uncharacterized protein n=1 Tax=Thermogymnomonas acidicola TaxID=399579 RepID=A0AA37F9M6_9ARCH|nr:hypothetical protein GCM10007108_12000 [Thermogymnomonas acidicola]
MPVGALQHGRIGENSMVIPAGNSRYPGGATVQWVSGPFKLSQNSSSNLQVSLNTPAAVF